MMVSIEKSVTGKKLYALIMSPAKPVRTLVAKLRARNSGRSSNNEIS